MPDHPHRRIRLAEDRAYTLEYCDCGKHPRILSVRALLRVWRDRPR